MAAAHIDHRMLYILYQQLILSVIDYGLECLTLSKSQLERIDRKQNEAVHIILGCTRDTPLVCMRHILGIPTVFDRSKVLQTKLCLCVSSDKDHMLYYEINAPKVNRLKRGKSWMAQAEEAIRNVTNMSNINKGGANCSTDCLVINTSSCF